MNWSTYAAPRPGVAIVRAAHLDLREHVLVAGLPALGVDVDHRAADVEERDHLGAIGRHGQRVHFARRLEDEAALLRGPVVLEIFPAAPDHVADDEHRMAVARQHAGAAHAQQVAPAAAHRVEQQRPEPDVLRLRHPHALVVGNRLHGDLGANAERGRNRCGNGEFIRPSAVSLPSAALRRLCLERRHQRVDLGARVAFARKRPAGAPKPVARVAEVTFEHMHDAVRPAAHVGVVVLHDRVRLFPIAALQMPDCRIECHRVLRHDSCDQIAAIDRQNDAGDEPRRRRTQEDARRRRRRPAPPTVPAACARRSRRCAARPPAALASAACAPTPAQSR